MYIQSKFKVTFQDLDGLIKTEDVKTLHFNDMSAFKAETTTGKILPIDYTRVYLRQFSTKFDKLGKAIYFGDIVKMEKDGIVVHWSVGIVDGLACMVSEQLQTRLPLIEANCNLVEKVGDIYSDEALIMQPITEEIFNKMSGLGNKEIN
jgi:hypothetical protein